MNTYEIYFSPTGGTKKVSTYLANELNKNTIRIDLCDSKEEFHKFALTSEDIAVISVPSYSGRVPATAAERLSQIKGNGAKAIIMCVYGNRDYEDTLAELHDIVQKGDFVIVAAAAAVAEHSIAHKYAANRPDMDDYKRLKEFAESINEKLGKRDFTTPKIPGNRPYREAKNVGIVPKATKACTKCGICAFKCPVGAIDKNNPEKVDKKICISCMRCASVCPHKARKVNGLMICIVNMMLKKACSERKECELFI